MRVRKCASFLEEWKKEIENNPIVKKLEDIPEPKITERKHTKELQEKLVQLCIDYIKENNLSDIDAVYFSFDGIQPSVEFGEWDCCSDSSIKLRGIKKERFERKDGTIVVMPSHYDIDSYC